MKVYRAIHLGIFSDKFEELLDSLLMFRFDSCPFFIKERLASIIFEWAILSVNNTCFLFEYPARSTNSKTKRHLLVDQYLVHGDAIESSSDDETARVNSVNFSL